ncbi:MAG: phosphoribosylformylglycinamidine synthase subunit PurQ [Verrucomicrobiae bacterium]|nr:phosphoribosylformylglycinamidine synthase subunit PurQ [Verrucomicrobiae bacterium]
MEDRPCALLLKFPGTNCDAETARALEAVGFVTEVLPVSALKPEKLVGVSLVVLSGGFSYGDYVMSGRIASLVTEQKIGETLKDFRDNGGYLLGICNGFQILTQLDLLPAGSLVENASGRFQCQWVKLKNLAPKSPFLSQCPAEFELPIAHAEGRLVTKEAAEAAGYVKSGAAALVYGDDVNGSFERIAGLQDESGRVFGLMPHPERFMKARDHYDPDWEGQGEGDWGSGYWIFKSLYQAIKEGEV